MPNLTPEMMLILGAIGGFVAKELWPWLRSRIDMNYKDRLARRQQSLDSREDRYLAALEMSANAARQGAENGKEIAAAIKTISETRVSDNLVLQRVERELERALTLLIELAALQGHQIGESLPPRIRPPRIPRPVRRSGEARERGGDDA